MTTDYKHPITPPEDLVRAWASLVEPHGIADVFASIAQWGSDQQLAKDAEWLDHNALNEPHLRITPMGESLKKAMRPKPLTVKEQAIAVLENAGVSAAHYNILLRGLEQLDD